MSGAEFKAKKSHSKVYIFNYYPVSILLEEIPKEAVNTLNPQQWTTTLIILCACVLSHSVMSASLWPFSL